MKRGNTSKNDIWKGISKKESSDTRRTVANMSDLLVMSPFK